MLQLRGVKEATYVRMRRLISLLLASSTVPSPSQYSCTSCVVDAKVSKDESGRKIGETEERRTTTLNPAPGSYVFKPYVLSFSLMLPSNSAVSSFSCSQLRRTERRCSADEARRAKRVA